MLTPGTNALVPWVVSKFARSRRPARLGKNVSLPPHAIETRSDARGRAVVLDPIRRRWVRLTPEEGVRQELLRQLIALGYPAGLMAVERPFRYLERSWRADIVAYDRERRPLLLAECKAPGVPLGQGVLDQLARYNVVVRAEVLVLTNGAQMAVGVPENGVVRRLEAIPPFGSVSHRI
jgi:hypothetical protein